MAQYEFDSIVIGGGAAGLTAAGISANFGAKTMMIEADKLGGDCTWTGCIPSKSLLKAGKVSRQLREASRFGLIDQDPLIDFERVMEHVDQVRREVYEDADRPEIFEEMGIEVVHGKAAFVDENVIRIEEQDGTERIVTSRYFFIATGARPMIPEIEGLDSVDYLTNQNLFDLRELPSELIIIGAGPIGIEMSQAFNDLGSKVTVIDIADRILIHDDEETTGILQKVLQKQGIGFELGTNIEGIHQAGSLTQVQLAGGKVIRGDRLLIAAGRKPNVDELSLEMANVDYTQSGIIINDSCRTNQRNIYAIGDVTGRFQFTHMSEHMAKVATARALLKFPMKIDKNHVPWVTYTSPELAHVGATRAKLRRKKISYQEYRFPYSKIDRALSENESEGLIKIYAKKWTGKILGVSVVGAHAGELISEYAVAMKNGVSMRKLADTIHPYPTWSLGARRAADQWYIKNQSESTVKWIQRIFRYRGEIPDYSDPNRIV